MENNIGITTENRQYVSDELAKLLGDEFVLYIKTRNAHWNVEGMDFYAKHIFFESQYKEVDEILDSVAERMRKIDHYAPATLTQLLQLSHLTEVIEYKKDSRGYVKILLEDHESIIIFLRGIITPIGINYGDVGTSDFLTTVLAKHEKMAWILRAHLG